MERLDRALNPLFTALVMRTVYHNCLLVQPSTLGAIVFLMLLASVSSGQQSGPAQQAVVPTSYANVHAGPSSNGAPLVLVPQGTVLPIVGRRGEWVQVQLSPELRRAGIVMRWYVGRHQFMNDGQLITIGDEDSGWMHDSTVEITEVETP